MVLVQVVAHYDKPRNHHICHCVYINIIIFFIITIINSSLSSTFDKNQYHYHHQSQFNAASPHCTAFFTLFNSTSLCSVLLLSILCFVQKRTMGQLALETVEVRTFAYESNLIFVSFSAAGCCPR